MAILNHPAKEITAKIVYYGPGLSGKTTNLAWIHAHLASKTKGDLISLATEQERTLFFDFLFVDLGLVRGMRTRLQLYTVPGQVFYESMRRKVLKGADAVVFVCDSQAALLEANIASFDSLRENIIANELDLNLPLVMQYNKRDLPTALPISVLNAAVNPRGIAPAFEAVATQGIGVEETLKGVTKRLFMSLADLYGASPAAPESETEPRPAPAGRVSTSVGAEPAAGASRRPGEPGNGEHSDPAPQGADLRQDQWIYLLDGKQRGPVELDDLIELLLTSIPENTNVWRQGLSTWSRANVVPEIAEHIPPPLPFATTEEDFPDFKTVPEMLRVVLIAFEDAAFRKLLARPLAAQGFKIHEAKDGAEAWAIATRHPLWLILADLDMAEIDGFEFCRRVRNSSLLRQTPIIFISGSDRYKDRYRAMQLGADDFLSKQTPIRELLIRVQLLMTRYSDLETGARRGEGGGASAESGALQGRIEVFGAAAVLQIIHQGQLSGVLSARRQSEGADSAVFGFHHGQIVSATCQDTGGAEAVYAFLAWERGQFSFIPGDPGARETIGNVEYLLLEGCRRLDEARYSGDTDPIG
jgi:DNA-binding response OmpR family regulator/signal recognition particle receptor subunit beta